MAHCSNSGGREAMLKAEEHPDPVGEYLLLKDKSQNRTSGFTLATPRGQNGWKGGREQDEEVWIYYQAFLK